MKKIMIILPLLLILCSCNKSDYTAEQYNTMYEHLTYCWSQSLEGYHFDNAFFGDSRVIGGDFVGEFSEKSVVNLGVGGDKINDLIRRFSLIESTTPTRVFLSIGGNDILSGKYEYSCFASEYTQLLQMFKDKNIDVVIHSNPGITTANSSYSQGNVDEINSKMIETNLLLRDLAVDFEYTFVDLASVMNGEDDRSLNPEYSLDGVHFNESGYEIWYNTIKDYLI